MCEESNDHYDIHNKICSRAVLIKSVYHLWCEGDSWDELFHSLSELPTQFTAPYYDVLINWYPMINRSLRVGSLIL